MCVCNGVVKNANKKQQDAPRRRHLPPARGAPHDCAARGQGAADAEQGQAVFRCRVSEGPREDGTGMIRKQNKTKQNTEGWLVGRLDIQVCLAGYLLLWLVSLALRRGMDDLWTEMMMHGESMQLGLVEFFLLFLTCSWLMLRHPIYILYVFTWISCRASMLGGDLGCYYYIQQLVAQV